MHEVQTSSCRTILPESRFVCAHALRPTAQAAPVPRGQPAGGFGRPPLRTWPVRSGRRPPTRVRRPPFPGRGGGVRRGIPRLPPVRGRRSQRRVWRARAPRDAAPMRPAPATPVATSVPAVPPSVDEATAAATAACAAATRADAAPPAPAAHAAASPRHPSRQRRRRPLPGGSVAVARGRPPDPGDRPGPATSRGDTPHRGWAGLSRRSVAAAAAAAALPRRSGRRRDAAGGRVGGTCAARALWTVTGRLVALLLSPAVPGGGAAAAQRGIAVGRGVWKRPPSPPPVSRAGGGGHTARGGGGGEAPRTERGAAMDGGGSSLWQCQEEGHVCWPRARVFATRAEADGAAGGGGVGGDVGAPKEYGGSATNSTAGDAGEPSVGCG